MKERTSELTPAEARRLLIGIDTKLTILLTMCASRRSRSYSLKDITQFLKQFGEALQSIISAIPYILNWGTWIGSALLVWWKWLLPYVRSFVGF